MKNTYKLSSPVQSSMISEDQNFFDDLKKMFANCRVNFLIGAGFSANLINPLGNIEKILETIEICKNENIFDKSQLDWLSAYVFWIYFEKSILPVKNINYQVVEENRADKGSSSVNKFAKNVEFCKILSRIFEMRSNSTLERQFNIFTTNYDPIIELAFDKTNCICNDGFEGKIKPTFSTANFAKSYYRNAVFSNRKSEVPSVNLFKIHGSLTWKKDKDSDVSDRIFSQDCFELVTRFNENKKLFNPQIIKLASDNFTSYDNKQIESAIHDLFNNDLVKIELSKKEKLKELDEFKRNYFDKFVIVNPTKKKFSDTLLDMNYYEMLRIFSNEIEKENCLLIVFGFSFSDEHLLDLVKRSMVNPSLQVLVFVYKNKYVKELQQKFTDVKHNNISFISLKKGGLDLQSFNQILSTILN